MAEWKTLTAAALPKNVLEAEYAVRGAIVSKSMEMEEQLKSGNHSLPFDQLVPCNIGNPQAVGDTPITYHRQVVSLLSNPDLVDTPEAAKVYPKDVLDRAKKFLGACAKMGAYSHSKGVKGFRDIVAEFIDKRDGSTLPKCDPEDLYLTDGASAGVKTALELLISSPTDAILIPTPQYPLYSASCTRLGGVGLGYEMTEDYSSGEGWGIDEGVVQAQIDKYVATGGKVRAMAVINPGNPVGNVMTREQMEGVVRVCEKNKVLLMADEVYQENIYAPGKEFISFRKVVHEMGAKVQVMSFHSISKGYYGECGIRGGVMHLQNIDEDVNEQIYKLFSMTLCSNTIGQAMVASILNPPEPGEPSYELFHKEKKEKVDALNRKAVYLADALNSIEGCRTLPIEGAMYAFPEVFLPKKFVEECQAKGASPDGVYCMKMLEATGVVTVPGSGFGQKPGTWHYRITILPKEEMLKKVMGNIKTWHEGLINSYLSPGEKIPF
jgi:alanine transaminase